MATTVSWADAAPPRVVEHHPERGLTTVDPAGVAGPAWRHAPVRGTRPALWTAPEGRAEVGFLFG